MTPKLVGIPDDAVVVSQSLIGNYDLCAYQLRWRDHPDYIKQPNSAMSFGSAVHAAIEAELRDIKSGGHRRDWSQSDFEELWDVSLLSERDGSWRLHELAHDKVYLRSMLDQQVAAIYKWREQVEPTMRSLLAFDYAIEAERSLEIGTLADGTPVWFNGTADLWIPEIHLLLDWKTAGRGWNETKAQFTGQVPAYMMLFPATSFEFWVFNRAKLRWDRYETTRTKEEIEAYRRHAMQVAAGIHADVYPVRNVQSAFGKFNRTWQCTAKWCPAWNACDAKYLHDDKYEQQIADPREGWTT